MEQDDFDDVELEVTLKRIFSEGGDTKAATAKALAEHAAKRARRLQPGRCSGVADTE